MRFLKAARDKVVAFFRQEPAVVIAAVAGVVVNVHQYVTDNWDGQDGWRGLGLAVLGGVIRHYVSPALPSKPEVARSNDVVHLANRDVG